MSKKIYMGKSLEVRYDEACKTPGGKLDRREILEMAEADLEAEGSRVQINKRQSDLIDIRVLPSLHSIMENALAVIDSEVRHHLRVSTSSSGLDRQQVHSFGQMIRSLAQIVGIEKELKEQSDLDAMSAADLMKLAEMTSDRLKDSKK